MSGKMGGYGKHGMQAIQMALDEINGQGGILGRKVEAIFEDDELKVDKGVQITKKFIN
jgi:branched-chain amino acid transport system substrate-binding protein